MRYQVDTQHPVAVDSPDHIKPLGTRRDNSTNLQFNRKLQEIVLNRPLRVLDLGCAGGGMVRTFVDMGHIAIGIEGSDYCKLRRKDAWEQVPEYLFTADITKPFTVRESDGNPAEFDVVTAWEFFEHIQEKDLPGVIGNISNHLKKGGLLIATINTHKSIPPDYHQTVMEPLFWIRLFEVSGFAYRLDLVNTIEPDWVRIARHAFALVMELR